MYTPIGDMLTTTDEIWKAYRQEKDGDVKERLLMIIWLKEGVSSYEVGRRLNCPHSKALYWQKRFKKKGMLGLHTMPNPVDHLRHKRSFW